jgi:hypothetical protein
MIQSPFARRDTNVLPVDPFIDALTQMMQAEVAKDLDRMYSRQEIEAIVRAMPADGRVKREFIECLRLRWGR